MEIISMSRIRFHSVAALVVLGVSAAWVATGKFTFVGSAAGDAGAEGARPAVAVADKPTPAAAAKVIRTVGVMTPEFTQHLRLIRMSGVTVADKRTTLATRSAGVIGQLNVKKGDWVKQGDVVAMLDGTEKAAAVETAKALLVQRQKEFDNAAALVKRGISPKTQEDNAFSALTAARSQLEAAQAELDRLHVNAPFSGVIDSVFVEKASWAPSGHDVAVLLALDPVVAKGEISERELSSVAVGGEADVRLVDGTIVQGTIRHISLEATSETRTFPIEVAIANPDNKIPAGMTAEIQLKAEPVQAVVLPRSVVTLDAQGNLGIRVISADSKVGFVPIDLIDDTPKGLVLGGIPEGARIIVAGQDLVSDGDTVNAVEVGADMLAGIKTGSTK
jgi:multidrug efflux system membrane fusion protein